MSPWLRELWQAWRGSLRRPGFVLMASGVLAIGIAATVSSVALLQNTLFKPLPFADGARLVTLGEKYQSGHVRADSSWLYQHMQNVPPVSAQGVMMDATSAVNMGGAGKPEQVQALTIDRHLLPTLQLQPLLGRNFTEVEDRPNGPRAVMLSEAFWRSHFAADPNVLGHILQVEGRAHTIVAVLPKSFATLAQADLVLPVAWPADAAEGGPGDYVVIGRLAKGATIEEVDAQLTARIRGAYLDIGRSPEQETRSHYGAEWLGRNLYDGSAVFLRVLGLVGACVLLIGVVNLTNLMLARSLARSHAAAVRHALGASLLQMAWPGLAEGLLIGLLAAIGGLLLGALALRASAQWLPDDWGSGLSLGWGAWLAALLSGAFGALLAAALGIWRSHAAGVLDELREGGRAGQGRYSGRLGRALVVVQVALASCLLCGAGMFLHALFVAAHAPMGFDVDQVELMELNPLDARYHALADVEQFSTRLVQRLRAIPGAIDAAAASNPPAEDFRGQMNMEIKTAPDAAPIAPQYHAVGPGFFTTFGIPLLKGRLLTRQDVTGSEAVAVINASMEKRQYAGDALGKYLWMGRPDGGTRGGAIRIVGVVGDTHQLGPLEGELWSIVYVPFGQFDPFAYGMFRSFEPMRYAMRVKGNPDGYADAMRKAVAEISPDQPIGSVRSMQLIVHQTTSDVRMQLALIGAFAVSAVLLAAVGMYAVISAVMLGRRREFGLRLALGASPLRLAWLVLRDGLGQSVVGLVVGLLLSLELGHLLRLIFLEIGRPPYDPMAMAAVAFVLLAVGLIASLAPAIRASRIAPMQALRDD